ncbi:MAG: histone deacetylase [Deltaproteobacteria bacterium]|nr:histone deacetylase [Deltaproteobacteria bacterium]
MANTGIVIDPRYQEHETGVGHPERPERIGVLLSALEESMEGLSAIPPREASGEEIALVHDGAYVADVEATAHKQRFAFDPDTPTSPRSYDTARLAAGGFLALLDAIVAGEVDNGFAFVRPPGHHAERHRAMGFCLFNNAAIGAEYLRRRYGIERVLIVDWDLHHGNGTQHMFEDDPGVLYVSTHQYPYYPGTGALDESGCGSGEGYTVNVPLPAGCADAEYRDAFRRVIEPIAHLYEPQFVLISAGFDAHARDPLGGMNLSASAFGAMARSLLAVAAAHASGRCAAILEGGYDLQAICASSSQVLAELSGKAPALESPPGASRIDAVVERFVRHQKRYWKI